MNPIKIQQLNEEHIPDLIRLSERLGWDYDKPELQTAFRSGSLYGHLNAGKVISSAAIFPYGKVLASLGMVMVDPEFRRMGLGKEAATKCLNLHTGTPVTLVTTKEGKSLYERLGFQTVDYVHKLIGEYSYNESVHVPKNIEMKPLLAEDLEEMTRLDSIATGSDRSLFLANRFHQAKDTIQIRRKNGEMLGYGFSISLPEMTLIGPIIAKDQDLALTLIHELAKKHRDIVRLDLLSKHQSLIQKLKNRDLKEIRRAPIMMKLADQLPGDTNQLFAVASQAFG